MGQTQKENRITAPMNPSGIWNLAFCTVLTPVSCITDTPVITAQSAPIGANVVVMQKNKCQIQEDIYLLTDSLSSMKDVRFTIKKRAFPSQGRVRLNIAHLPDLGILEGEHVDLINEATKKSVTTTVIADTMVRQGHVRVSEEDLKTIGLNDDDEVLVRKTPPMGEKIKKAAADANKSLSKSVDKLDEKVKKTAGDVKAGAAKAADTVKKETKKASDSIEKAAAKTASKVKKTVKRATGSDEDGSDEHGSNDIVFDKKKLHEKRFEDEVFDDAGFDNEH